MVPLKQLIENPQLIDELRSPPQLSQSGLYERTLSDGWQPSDLYYEQIGRLVEEHPIVGKRTRG